MPFEAIAMNWKHIDEFEMYRWEMLALELEKIRKLINEQNKSDLGFPEIGLRITSGFRCKAWELLRNRSGLSQHTICAADFQAINCSRGQAAGILKSVYSAFDPWWSGGLAIKWPYKTGTMLMLGFVHIDMRGEKARWVYS